MRDSLTALALLLILILTAALVGPYFIDWSAERGVIEARLSQAVGARVTIRGAVDLRLLPSPYLAVDTVEIGDNASPLRLSAAKLRLEIAVAPLLRGEIDFLEAQLEKPRLDLTLDADGSFPKLPQLPASEANIRFERIAIRDGTLAVHDPAERRSFALEEIALDAQAKSLLGPYKGDGALEIAGEKTAFQFAASAVEENRVPIKLVVDASASRPRADFDGALSLASGANGGVSPKFTGALKLESDRRGGIGSAPPWRLTGALEADARKARLKTLELRADDETRTLGATGEAELDYSAAPRASMSLRSSQIDLDHWLSFTGAPATPQSFAKSIAALMGGSLVDATPLPCVLSWTSDAASLGGESFRDLSATLAFGDAQAARLRFEVHGPGQSRLFLDGQLQFGQTPDFTGKIRASADNAPRFMNWLMANAPQRGQARRLPFHAVDLAGEAHVAGAGVLINDLDLRLDQSSFTGTIEYAPETETRPPRLAADLVAASLDLAVLPDLRPAKDLLAHTDLSLRLDADALTFGGAGPAVDDLGRLDLKLEKTDEKIELEEFTWEGSGGGVVTASGALSDQDARLDARIEAPRLDAFAALIAEIAPSPALELIASHAEASSPADFSLMAEAADSGEGFAVTALTLKGKISETQVAATIGPDMTQAGTIKAAARLDAKDSQALLRLLAPSAATDRLGPGHVEITARGQRGQPLDARIKAALAGTDFDFQGQVIADLKAPSAAGRLRLAGADLAPLLRASGLALPDLTTKLPADMSGAVIWGEDGIEFHDFKGSFAGVGLGGTLAYERQSSADKMLSGTINIDALSATALFSLLLGPPEPAKAGALWSSLQFPAASFDLPAGNLSLTVGRLDLLAGVSAKPAKMTLEIAPGLLGLRDFALKLGEGSATGAFELRREGATTALKAQVALDDYAFDLPGGRGRISAGFDLAGAGRSAETLMAGLAGVGHATIADYVLPNCDPSALARVFAASEQNRISLGQREVSQALANEFQHAALVLGIRDFDLGVASGVLRFSPTPTSDPRPDPVAQDQSVTAAVSASIDLRDATLDERLTIALNAPAKDWSGPPPQISLTLKGPLSHPVREIDATAFANALAARAIMRESARIEAYESDFHERADFNERLLSEQRRERERLKKEEAAGATN
ncbi:AsmA family protein [Methylocapsa polymorpha]|uniref:AsmA family protein n=1 Tax=Methylocapsa polymorpha TaxID=3080828 RepID=A0ABZ0HQX4_9HYPH|nr:AsmA family protein [Methylocapsa sp. RX1]